VSGGLSYRLDELAQRFALELRGNGATRIHGVGTLASANGEQLSFLANPVYRRDLAASQAAAVVLRATDAEACRNAALVASEPYVAFARIAALFEPRAAHVPGVHASAVVDPTAQVDPGAHLGPFVWCAQPSTGWCVIAKIACGASAGRARADPRVRRARCSAPTASAWPLIATMATIGSRCRNWAASRIGDDCEIGANTTIDRGALEDTVLEEDVRLDNQIQIAHNVQIGAHTAMAGCAAVAGSTASGATA
jgi:UDP-3-O-[3-hydroxymyristoyl] glucosamine N-acyltransferase